MLCWCHQLPKGPVYMKKKTKGPGPAAWLRENKWTCIVLAAALAVLLAAALVGQLRPAAVVCVDSLCSAEGQRLGRTVQFSDAGLYPAQADHTRHLTRDTLGVPVVAAGIPTLMQAQEGADLVVCLLYTSPSPRD